MSEKYNNIKIVIIGQPGVGKTSLRRSFLGEKFRTNYIETIGSDFSFKEIKIEDTELGLSIWDLAGQEKFQNVHPLFYKGSYGAAVVYSTVNRKSFEIIPDWVEKFISISTRKKLPIILIGNKIDLLGKSDESISLKEHNDLLEKLRENYPENKFISIRTSAKTGENVEQGFREFSKEILIWIKDKKRERGIIDIDKNMKNNFPSAFLFGMNQISGPVLIASSPKIENRDDELSIVMNSGIKLVASLEFEDIISQSSILSTFPWSKPSMTFYYIAFVMENDRARGNRELFVLGVNAIRELDEPISGLRGVINGFLHNAMNSFVRIVVNHELDFITRLFDKKLHKDQIDEIREILKELRKKFQTSLEKWYNIPN